MSSNVFYLELNCSFFVGEMDENQYKTWLGLIDEVESARLGEGQLQERVYNEHGSVPGCYRTLPAPTEE